MKQVLYLVGVPIMLFGAALLPNAAATAPGPRFIRCPGGRLTALVFSPDGKWVAAAYFDLKKETRLVGVWDATSLRPLFMDREKAGCKGIEALAFSPDNKQLLALGDSQDRNELLGWDTASGKRVKEQVRPRERHDPNRLWAGQARELLRGVDGR